ncbi:TIGR04282 family arsenosugar biosynthesis glycosyltransferase [Novipirellula sp. SH528]|uniref:TIGR04282 family arsenosugar biosynthesis glycosyltransferase n=1 Tax=Novipirellula sp. SH528 TaxID=3454466 RepID=UPI003FA0A8C3
MPHPSSELILGIMAKYWTAGKVKTRLGHSIGMQAAAEIHREFVLRLCRQLAAVQDRRILSLAPDSDIARISEETISKAWEITPQGDGDLGDRMSRFFQSQLGTASPETPPSRVVLIGADCPLLSASNIAKAAQQLESHDLVIGPAIDGGYYLIGLRGPWTQRFATLFAEMPWSSSDVFAITKQRAEESQLSLAVLSQNEDIDTIECLDRLRDHLQSSQPQNRSYAEFADRITAILSQNQNS